MKDSEPTTTQGRRRCYQPYFTDENTEAKVPHLWSSKAGIQTQAVSGFKVSTVLTAVNKEDTVRLLSKLTV